MSDCRSRCRPRAIGHQPSSSEGQRIKPRPISSTGCQARRLCCRSAELRIFEFAVAIIIGSVSLFADSIDFLEDTSINLLIAVALGWTTQNRARVGMLLAGILLVPGLATLWTAWENSRSRLHPNRQPFHSRASVHLSSI